MGVNFVVIFQREGTDIEATKAFFMEAGAEAVEVSYDYVIVDDDPGKAVCFFIKMPMDKYMLLSLKGIKLKQAPGLPAYHFITLE